MEGIGREWKGLGGWDREKMGGVTCSIRQHITLVYTGTCIIKCVLTEQKT